LFSDEDAAIAGADDDGGIGCEGEGGDIAGGDAVGDGVVADEGAIEGGEALFSAEPEGSSGVLKDGADFGWDLGFGELGFDVSVLIEKDGAAAGGDPHAFIAVFEEACDGTVVAGGDEFEVVDGGWCPEVDAAAAVGDPPDVFGVLEEAEDLTL
jgi:hypothetical protein